ncbi:hypothetical protein K458DRAFT_197586 [Lentithecium fluviatile CBS 122367]|uniref:Uncharacterized protein n=1 Tax=Lentithecium fluviatile CBS 122367 TaxID=1168545 RepID=A0A6G1IC93_9PLEO|nr:hypothetical protein K458DRAFT_197586 [Lentithecium fluviatile CBS 122367]
MTSVIESGADASLTAPPVAVSELSRGCSIQNVDPTSTVTSTFTAPPQRTFGQNRIGIVTKKSTRYYTTTASTTSGVGFSTSPGSSNILASTGSVAGSTASTILSGDSQPPTGGPVTFSNSTGSSANITSTSSVTYILSGSIPPTAFPSRPVVIGIPFSCPNGDGSEPRFVTGDLQYECIVLCNTAIVTDNEVTTIPAVENESACAAECSLINNAAGKSVCAAAVFTPAPGARIGSCLISRPTSNFVAQPDTTTMLLKGFLSKSDNCSSIDPVNGPGNATIDTAAIISSVTLAGFSLSMPGLVSYSEEGGEFRMRFSSASTGSDGWVFITWNESYKSSSA